MILLADEDFGLLSEGTRREVLSVVHAQGRSRIAGEAPLTAPDRADGYEGIDMSNVEDVPARMIARHFDDVPPHVRLGLLLIAQHGPIIKSELLLDAGISLRHFQSATTRRVRRYAQGEEVFLLGWDDWAGLAPGAGRYAVTPITHQALRAFFKLT
jgi:hypothetical protein